MQKVKFYVAAAQTLGVVRDYANARNEPAPTLVRGCEVQLNMRLFANADGTTPYPIEALSGVVSWQWVMDKDFSEATSYILEADNAAISVSSVTDEIDGNAYPYTEITIPIRQMNTTGLAEWLGSGKSQSGLNGELVGFDGNGTQVFVLQVENFTVRNRITSLGSPQPIDPDYLTAPQVRSLIAAGIVFQFSESGTEWHDTQGAEDRFCRIRSASDVNAVWSDGIALVSGPRGEKGLDSFCHVAYASDATGADFSLTPSGNLKYRAEIHTSEALEAPSSQDFADAVWVKYLGDDGDGVGDMKKETYDSDGDGVVDRSASADSVLWNNIRNRPETFLPALHVHSMRDLSNPVLQSVRNESDPKTLFLDSPLVRNTSANGSGTIELEFTSIMTTPSAEGKEYTVGENEMLTWEYHVLCSADVTGVTFGSLQCSMTGIRIPDTLERINDRNTYHVFVIRALYRSGAVGNVMFQANYAYSYEA